MGQISFQPQGSREYRLHPLFCRDNSRNIQANLELAEKRGITLLGCSPIRDPRPGPYIRNIVSPEVFPAGRGRFPQPEERPPWPPLLHDFKLVNNGAGRGGRTPMTRRSADFEPPVRLTRAVVFYGLQ